MMMQALREGGNGTMEEKENIQKALAATRQALITMETQKQSFFWLALGVIVVSFVHIAAVVSLFSGEGFLDRVAAILLAVVVDVYLAMASWYIDFRKQKGYGVSAQVWAVTMLALCVSLGMNLAYMVNHMPDGIPLWLAWPVAIGFSVLTTAIVWISSVISSEVGAMHADFRAQEGVFDRQLYRATVKGRDHENRGETPENDRWGGEDDCRVLPLEPTIETSAIVTLSPCETSATVTPTPHETHGFHGVAHGGDDTERRVFSIKDARTNARLLRDAGLSRFQYKKEATEVWGCSPASTTAALKLMHEQGLLDYDDTATMYCVNEETTP